MFVMCRQSFEIMEGNEILSLKNGEIANIDERWLKNTFVQGLIQNNLILVNPSTVDGKLTSQYEIANKKQEESQNKLAMDADIQKAVEKAKEDANIIAQDNGLDVASKEKLVKEKIKEAEEKVKKEYGNKSKSTSSKNS